METVIDAHTILMGDGKIIQLLGVEYPDPGDESGQDADVIAKTALEKMLKKGDEFFVWQTLNTKYGRTNRMGHILAHLQNKKTGEWVNGALVAEGFGWALTDKSNPDMAQALYALEEKARRAQKGIWAKGSSFGIETAESVSGDGHLGIVEGRVTKAAASKNNLFLNFGQDSKKDFTVMVSPALRKAFARKTIDLQALAGKTVRVRGWVRSWNGAFMELESVERLEILSTPPSTDLPPRLSPELSTKPKPSTSSGQANP